jgi:hypothetical protein
MDLFEHGEDAEKIVEEDFQERNYKYKKPKDIEENLKQGDLIYHDLLGDFPIEVKRRSVKKTDGFYIALSENCIEEFRGSVLVAINNDDSGKPTLNGSWALNWFALRKYAKKMAEKNLETLPSGDKGVYIPVHDTNYPFKSKLPYEEWVKKVRGEIPIIKK